MWRLWWEVQDEENPDKTQGEKELRPTFPVHGLQQDFQVGGAVEEPQEVLLRHYSRVWRMWKSFKEFHPAEMAPGAPCQRKCFWLQFLRLQSYKAGWSESAQEERARWGRRLCLRNLWRHLQQSGLLEGPQQHPSWDPGLPVHNMYFVKYIFPRNRTSSDIS